MDLKFLEFEQPIAELEARIDAPKFVGEDSELKMFHRIEEYARRLTIRWPSEATADFVRDLQRILKPFAGGRCEVCIEYPRSGAEAALTLGEAWSVRVKRELRDHLTRLLGDDGYLLHYPKHLA